MGQHEGKGRRDPGKPENRSERMCETLRHSEHRKPAQTRETGRTAIQLSGDLCRGSVALLWKSQTQVQS